MIEQLLAKLAASVTGKDEEITLRTEFVERLRASHDLWKARATTFERENRALRHEVMKWKARARGGN